MNGVSPLPLSEYHYLNLNLMCTVHGYIVSCLDQCLEAFDTLPATDRLQTKNKCQLPVQGYHHWGIAYGTLCVSTDAKSGQSHPTALVGFMASPGRWRSA